MPTTYETCCTIYLLISTEFDVYLLVFTKLIFITCLNMQVINVNIIKRLITSQHMSVNMAGVMMILLRSRCHLHFHLKSMQI